MSNAYAHRIFIEYVNNNKITHTQKKANKCFFLRFVVALKRAVWINRDCCRLFRSGVLRHGLGTLAYCVLGQFSRQQEANGSLNFAAADC